MSVREQFIKLQLILLDSSPVPCPTWGKSDVLFKLFFSISIPHEEGGGGDL